MQTTTHKRFDLEQHLCALRKAREEAFSEGDWERVNFIQMCIDDTQDHLTKLLTQK